MPTVSSRKGIYFDSTLSCIDPSKIVSARIYPTVLHLWVLFDLANDVVGVWVERGGRVDDKLGELYSSKAV